MPARGKPCSFFFDFAAELAQGQLRALRVDSPERHLEGCWWLCEIQGRATQATEQMACATYLFEVDWWIVEIKWYERVPDATDSASQTQVRIVMLPLFF